MQAGLNPTAAELVLAEDKALNALQKISAYIAAGQDVSVFFSTICSVRRAGTSLSQRWVKVIQMSRVLPLLPYVATLQLHLHATTTPHLLTMREPAGTDQYALVFIRQSQLNSHGDSHRYV